MFIFVVHVAVGCDVLGMLSSGTETSTRTSHSALTSTMLIWTSLDGIGITIIKRAVLILHKYFIISAVNLES